MKTPLQLLIVDDERLITTAIRHALPPETYECRLAGDETVALQTFLEEPPDCVLLDIRLASGDQGASLAKKMKEHARGRGCNIPIIAMTAFLPEMFDRSPFDGYIKKPFTTEEIERTIRTALERKDVIEEKGADRAG